MIVPTARSAAEELVAKIRAAVPDDRRSRCLMFLHAGVELMQTQNARDALRLLEEVATEMDSHDRRGLV